ncbi:MAG: formate dehydrogenase accessory sulfurtransferase FdhD [Polyangiaceae bacterium]
MTRAPDTSRVEIVAVRGDSIDAREDLVAAEEPMEIRAEGPGRPPARIAVTMRTPGHDVELAVGFLFTEGVIAARSELSERVVREAPRPGGKNQVITVQVVQPFDSTRAARVLYSTSSCGICGKAAIEHVEIASEPLAEGPVVALSTLRALPQALRSAQATFDRTGGLHATALFDIDGKLVIAREDVGRHNAMDKVVGRMVLDDRVPLSTSIALVSGRASFELVQKAAMAGVPILCAVSAPSSLAVALAVRLRMTLVAFLRDDRLNVYAGAERIDMTR